MADEASKPTPDCPLYRHKSGHWAKKINGKTRYFGKDRDEALRKYLAELAGHTENVPPPPTSAKAKRPPGFPLFAHKSGLWCKKVRGKFVYFGPIADRQGALDRWLRDKDELLAGRRPRAGRQGLTVSDLVNHFLGQRKGRLATGELKQRTWDDYYSIGQRIAKVFGRDRLVEDLGPDDFEQLRASFASTHGPVALGIDITRARTFFNYADETFQIRVRYGESFDKPSKSVLRKEKSRRPTKFFQAEEIKALLDAASIPLRAMIYLGINCGFGNDDCATIRVSDLDLKNGWHHYDRPKTGIKRRCPLWPETVKALKLAISQRPEPNDSANGDRVFITSEGNTWERTKQDSKVSKEMTKLTKRLGLHQRGVSFYSLRHTFQTVGDGSGQIVAVRYIMGHAPKGDDMAAIYREHTFEDNLLTVSNYVREWTFKHTQQIQAVTSEGTSAVPASGPRLRLFGAETSPEPRPKP